MAKYLIKARIICTIEADSDDEARKQCYEELISTFHDFDEVTAQVIKELEDDE